MVLEGVSNNEAEHRLTQSLIVYVTMRTWQLVFRDLILRHCLSRGVYVYDIVCVLMRTTWEAFEVYPENDNRKRQF